jgi:hypothetical protein
LSFSGGETRVHFSQALREYGKPCADGVQTRVDFLELQKFL